MIVYPAGLIPAGIVEGTNGRTRFSPEEALGPGG